MRLLNSRNSWTYSYGFNMMVDFCIWVLEVDGLHVPPFDQHPAGDASLQGAGLGTDGWQSWLIRIVNLQYEQQQIHQQRALKDSLNPQMDWQSMLIPEAHNPPAAWTGNAAVGSRLAELWEQYGPISNERRKWEIRLSRAWQQLEQGQSEGSKGLYDELRPYHRRIPTLIIHLVNYAQPINYLIPPVSVIMTATNGQPDAAEFRERVLDAASGLTLAPTSRGGRLRRPRSWSSQSTSRYKTYPRKPVQPVTSQSGMHNVAENEAKQIILDQLNDENGLYGEVNMATVQFLREKTIPGWQMHYVSFAELDGRQQSLVIILRQREDGSWMFDGASTGDNFRDAVARFFLQVHDHPLISISGRKTGHAGDDGPQYEFVANGEVIDNGFDVTRVRLVNDTGQVFEDTVQDGLVLFASIQDQEVQWPVQAELYNRAGELVWRETVLSGDLPSWIKFK